MSGVINIGGLATGLDTNSIIAKLVSLEQRPIDLLSQQMSDLGKTKSSISTLSSKLLTLKSAAEALDTTDEVLTRKATSSDETVASTVAGLGAQRGATTITVTDLAHGSVAGSTVGTASADDTIAAGDGTFQFQVGSGDVQSVSVSATTTLQQLADDITALGAGVRASAVNFGTDASPDWRLQIASTATGASSTITVVHDDTSLAVATSQTGQNASFTISGFSGTFQRESNTFSDVLQGVTISLRSAGTTTVTVDDDTTTIGDKVKALVAAYNDIQSFVAQESTVSGAQGADALTIGSLAGNSTARLLLSRLQETFTSAFSGATTRYVNLASLGLATQNDGTIVFDESKLDAAIADNATAVAQVFAGNGTVNGVAQNLSSLVQEVTGAAGSLTVEQSSIDDRTTALQDDIDAGQRNLTTFENNLRAQFTALETLVSTLQTQSAGIASLFSLPTH
jgi:flagellar hook-associated protein 2